MLPAMPDGGKHLLFAEAQKFGRGDGGAENAAGRSRMESQLVMEFRLQRHGQARGDFVSGDDGGHKLAGVDFRDELSLSAMAVENITTPGWMEPA